MERMTFETIKDFFISILIIACIVIVLAIIFYDDISLGKQIPEVEEYVFSDEMQKELADTELDETKEIIVNYYIDASDLQKYEDAKEYKEGKGNPFGQATLSSTYDNDNNTSNNNDSENFYEDEGIK